MAADGIPTEPRTEAALRRTRIDARGGNAPAEGYVAPGGETKARTGTEEAPYVHSVGYDLRGDGRGAPATYSSAALETQAVIKAGPGRLYTSRILVPAALGFDAWLMYFNVADTTTALGGTEVPLWRVALPDGALESGDEVPNGIFFPDGMVVAISTTIATLTLPLGGTALFQIGFI